MRGITALYCTDLPGCYPNGELQLSMAHRSRPGDNSNRRPSLCLHQYLSTQSEAGQLFFEHARRFQPNSAMSNAHFQKSAEPKNCALKRTPKITAIKVRTL